MKLNYSILKLIVLITFMTINHVISQNDKQIIYDFNTEDFELSKRINQGDMVRLTVINANPFIYRVNSTNKLTTKNPVPTNLFSLISGDFLKVLSFPSNSNVKTIPLEINFLSLIGDEAEASEALNCVTEMDVSFFNQAQEEFSSTSKLYSDLYFSTTNIDLEYSKLVNLVSEINEIETDVSKPLEEAYFKLKSAYLIIKSKSANENCDKFKGMKGISQSITELEKHIIPDGIETEISVLENLRRSAQRIIEDGAVNSRFEMNISKLIAKGDELDVTLELTPLEELNKFENAIHKISASKKFDIQNHFKISFSPGLLTTNGLNDEKFNVKALAINDSITKFQVIKEDESNWDYGISALIHFTWEMNQGALGFNLGLGYLPEDSKIAGLAGVSAIFGKDQSLILSAGLAGSSAKTLSDALDTTTQYSSAPEVKTKRVFKGGFWFGIGYRL